MTLSGINIPAEVMSLTQVDNCSANISIRKGDGIRSFYIYNINGDVDMTNSSSLGSIVFSVTGTVLNPGATSANKPIAFGILPGANPNTPLIINPGYAYADNVTALGAGRVVGEVYRRTTDGALMVVY
jgi:hypothetical protein